MVRATLMLLCFAAAGLNVWCIAEQNGGLPNYIATAVCLGSGAYVMASLVRHS